MKKIKYKIFITIFAIKVFLLKVKNKAVDIFVNIKYFFLNKLIIFRFFFVILFLTIAFLFSYYYLYPEYLYIKNRPISPPEELFAEEVIEEEKEKPVHVSFKTINDGFDIYVPPYGQKGYRYGPSIIINDDGSYDIWQSSPGNGKQWDYIRYRHSKDGIEWSDEEIVLKPTINTDDKSSVCDPGVFYYNGYYYLGYTATTSAASSGYDNNIFISRSEKPDGPFEKWNGESWGGNPKAIIEYDGSKDYWGAGEISFINIGSKLYCYYSWISEEGNVTKVATADLSKGDSWPTTIKDEGIAYEKHMNEDSFDFVYIDDLNIFIGIAAHNRMSSGSGIVIIESYDGIHYDKSDIIKSGISMYCHNVGISKRKNGHIDLKDKLMIGYAYATNEQSWGKWALRVQNIDLIIYHSDSHLHFDHNENGEPTYRNFYE